MAKHKNDDFDELARQRSHAGAHRKPRNSWKNAIPFLIAIIVAPILAWGTIYVMSHKGISNPLVSGEETTTSPQTIASDTEDPTEEETTVEETTEEPTEEESTEETPSEDGINFDVTITVLNGTSIGGLAGETAAQLNAEGFNNTTTGDYTSPRPTVPTLYFRDASLYDTAQRLAEILGIDMWAESAGATGTSDIVVVLR